MYISMHSSPGHHLEVGGALIGLPLYSQHPLDRRLGGPQSRTARHGEMKILDTTWARTSNPRPIAVASGHPDCQLGEESLARNQRQSMHLVSRWILARLIFRPWRWKRKFSPKRKLTLKLLRGVTSQKTVIFITTAVITSNPVRNKLISIFIYFW
jgi:hypothetical protein